MGLLLSVLITCVGVLEVIACYTHFRIGVAYKECKSNIRDVAKYYAVELRKHELHFDTGPDDSGTSHQETLSELIQQRSHQIRSEQLISSDNPPSSTPEYKSTVRVQEKSQQYSNGHIITSTSSSSSSDGTSATTILKVPQNSLRDSPISENVIEPNLNISEAINNRILNQENSELFWTRKSSSSYDKTGLEVVEKDFWKSRSPSPFPESRESDSGVDLLYSPNNKSQITLSLSDIEDLSNNTQCSPTKNELVDKDYWKRLSPDLYDDNTNYSNTDLEVQNIIKSLNTAQEVIPRQPSPYPEILFGITPDNEDSKFDEAFLRSLDGVKSKCDDRRRSFKKKRNSSSTSSRASKDDTRSVTSLDDFDDLNKRQINDTHLSKITPLTEEVTEEQSDCLLDNNNKEFIRTESVVSEKCKNMVSPVVTQTNEQNKNKVKLTNQQETLFQANVQSNSSQQMPDSEKGKANLAFTEKVKDLEISVQLCVTVKGTSQGDKMEYVTSVSQDNQKPSKAVEQTNIKENSLTRTIEEKSEYGNVKTSVTYGNVVHPTDKEDKSGLKDLQISSQSLIHAERTLQDNVKSNEAEFLKLYESFTELSDLEKNKFLKIIGQTKTEQTEENNVKSNNETIVKDNDKTVKPERNEQISITEITEITESIENVTIIPPENKTDINKSLDESIKLNKANRINTSSTEDPVYKQVMIHENISLDSSQNNSNKNIGNFLKSNIKSKIIIDPKIEDYTNQIDDKDVNFITKDKERNEVESILPNLNVSSPQSLQEICLQTKLKQDSISVKSCDEPLRLKEENIKSQIELSNESSKLNEKSLVNSNKELLNQIEQNVKSLDETLRLKKENKESQIETSNESLQLKEKSLVDSNEELSNQTEQNIKSFDEPLRLKKENKESQIEPSNVSSQLKEKSLVNPNEELSNQIEHIEIDNKQNDKITPKCDSSSESSSTPTTAIETSMRRASKTSFEDATPSQNKEMMKRRVSNSENNPNQASQAFWVK